MGKGEFVAPTEILITDTLAAAVMFAHQLGWRQIDTARFIKPDHVVVSSVREVERLMGVRKLIAHVGPFANTADGRALRRHLINIAESRGAHVIPYDLDVEPPAPLRFCLICGATNPCMWPEDLQPGEPGTPCTFDLTYLDMVKLLRRVQSENAELRRQSDDVSKRLEGAEAKISEASEEIAEIRRNIKAYRTGGNPQRIHSIPGGREKAV